MILNNSLETLRTEYLPDIYNAIRSSIIEAPSVPLSHEDIVRHGYVGHAQFNDMVIIYSLEDHPDAHRNVINATYHLLALSILFPYIRFRIGISYGEFYYDKESNIYIGKAFLEALELAEYQEWVAPLAYSQLYERDPLKSIIVEYNVPLKKGP